MTDPDKLAAFKALAGGLGSSMKEKVIKKGVEDEAARTEAKILQDKLNVERQKMLSILEGDIDALGWNQCPKAYAVDLDDNGDEQLNFIEDVPGDPVMTLMHLAVTGELKHEAVALVMASEYWSYPDYLDEALKDDDESRRALFNLLPSSIHPQRKEGRLVTLVDRTGQAVAVQRVRNEEPKFITDKDTDVRITTAMKCLLGLDRKFNKMRDMVGRSMSYLSGMINIFTSGQDECWCEQQYVEAIRDHLVKFKGKNGVLDRGDPLEQAKRLMSNMPTELRQHLGLE